MRLKRFINLFCLPLILCVFLFFLFMNNTKRPMGQLVFESETLHFGKIPLWQKEPITKTIKCRNAGRKTLLIRRVNSNCGCYSVTEYPQQLAPGEVGTFTLSAEPPKVRPKASIHVVTDIPRQPDVYFAVFAEPVPYAKFNPPVCDFGEINSNTIHEKVVRLNLNAPIDKSAVELAPYNEDKIISKIEFSDQSTIELKIQLGPVVEQRFFSTLLTCILPGERTISLPITAKVVSRVKVTPEYLLFKPVGKEKHSTSTLSFTFQSKHPFEVLKIESPSVVKIKFRKSPYSDQTNDLIVQVDLSLKEIDIPWREEIRIFTNAEQNPIRIPVYVVNTNDNNIRLEMEVSE